MKDYRIVIDQSTSGTKGLLYSTNPYLKLEVRKDLKHEQIYPKKGWVEHNPQEIIVNVKNLLDELIEYAQAQGEEVKSISITNQRESVLLWDRYSNKTYTNVMVWQCNRGNKICEDINSLGYESVIKEKTGLKLDTYFSASKLKWFFDNNSIPEDRLRIGTIDTWIIWNLTKGEKFVTDISNACRTLLYNINNLKWDNDLLEIFNIPNKSLAKVLDSVDDFGKYKGIPILSVLGDSQSALIANDCVEVGDVKATLGTGSSILMNCGSKIDSIKEESILTIAWKKENDLKYATESIIRSFGDVMAWMKDNLNLYSDYNEALQAFKDYDNGGVVFIPSLEGLATPFYRSDIQAEFDGLSRSTLRGNLIRAGYESMAFQLKLAIDHLEDSNEIKIKKIFVDGGLSKVKDFIQYISDLLEKEVIISNEEEASAVGTLKILGIEEVRKERERVTPNRNQEAIDSYRIWYDKLYEKLKQS